MAFWIYLSNGGSIPNQVEAFLWKMLRNLLSKGIPMIGPTIEDLPEPAVPGDTAGVDAKIDLCFFLDRYAVQHPVEAHTLRVWLIDCDGNANEAARELITEKNGDPDDAQQVAKVKDKLSVYFRRFALWCFFNFPDYFQD